jgi:hypothetical protein
MSRSFEENREMVGDSIQIMEQQLARMNRTYNKYIKHGAVNAAAELLIEMEALESDIQCEQYMYRMAFY